MPVLQPLLPDIYFLKMPLIISLSNALHLHQHFSKIAHNKRNLRECLSFNKN